jgi:carboxypeptidase family protein
MSNNRWGLNLFLLILVVIWADSALLAQQDKGTIAGIVFDQSGAVIPNAKVTLKNAGTSQTRTMTTGTSGEYVFTPVEVGIYEITVEVTGFQSQVKRNLQLQVQQKLDVNFTLQVGTESNIIDVEATAPPLQTSDSSLGQVVDTQKVVNLPLNGRDIYQLVYLVPGVVTSPNGQPSLSGQTFQQGGYTMDGIDNNNYQGNLLSGGKPWTLSPSPDAIQEFKVMTNNYSAEFGFAGAGVVNVLTKSGTNDFHGSLYEFIRNDVFDARNFFAQSKAPFKQNQFGASLGGPLTIPKVFNGRNRVFFFIDYEGFRSRKGTTQNVLVAPVAWRQGDFREFLTGQSFIDPCTGASYDTGQIFDPTSTRQATCRDGSTAFVRNPISFNGQANVVDPARIVAAARNTSASLPLPNSGDRNYIWSPSLRNDFNRFDVKIDHQWGQNDRFSWRYSFTDAPPKGIPQFPGPAASGDQLKTRQQGISFGETHTFSPRTINEFRYGYTRNAGDDELLQSQLDASTLGYGGIPYEPGVLAGLPGLSISGVDTFGSSAWVPAIYKGRSSQFVDTLSLIRGKHTFKVGGAHNRYGWIQYQPYGSGVGQYGFTGILTANLNAPSSVSDAAASGAGYAQFLFGIPDSAYIGNSIWADNIRWTGSVFIQDDWKITPKLTVNAGLRWEFANTMHEAFDRLTGLDLTTDRLQIPKTRENQQPGAPPGFPTEYVDNNSLFLTSNKNLGPRLGLAYQAFSKTVIRSAFGIFFGNPYMAGTIGYPLNPPWAAGIQVNAPRTGPVDPVTGEPVIAVTSITSGFPPGFLTQLLAPPSLFLYDSRPKWPTTYNWNMAVQQDVGGNVVVEVAYSGTKGSHIMTGLDYNQPTATADPNSDPQSRRPHATFGQLPFVTTSADSHYQSLQVKAEKRFSQGLTFLSSYTWSHSTDNAPLCLLISSSTEYGGDCPREFNLSIEKGNSPFDVRHRFTTSALYDLPWGKGRPFGSQWSGAVNQILGGWRIGGIIQLQSGFPLTPITYYDPANAVVYFNPARAQSLGNPTDFSYGQDAQKANGCPGGSQTLQCWFNPSAFGFADPGQFGNAGRDVVRGPGITSIDFSLHKDFPISETKRFEFRAEFFNLPNHPNFKNPDNAVDGGRFGTIFATRTDPRDIQFALKFVF